MPNFHIPSKFRCPLTKKIMAEPVIASDGVTYELEAIEEKIRLGQFPNDGDLIYNKYVISEIRDFVNNHADKIPLDDIYLTRPTLLLMAIEENGTDNRKLNTIIDLLEKDSNLLTKELLPGRTVMHVAAEKGTLKMVETILAKFDEIETQKEKKYYEQYRNNGYFKSRHHYYQRTIPADWNPVVLNQVLIEACIKNDVESAAKMLRLGANVNYKDSTGQSCLDYALYNNYKSVVRLLGLHFETPFNHISNEMLNRYSQGSMFNNIDNDIINRQLNMEDYIYQLTRFNYIKLAALEDTTEAQSKQLAMIQNEMEENDKNIAKDYKSCKALIQEMTHHYQKQQNEWTAKFENRQAERIERAVIERLAAIQATQPSVSNSQTGNSSTFLLSSMLTGVIPVVLVLIMLYLIYRVSSPVVNHLSLKLHGIFAKPNNEVALQKDGYEEVNINKHKDNSKVL